MSTMSTRPETTPERTIPYSVESLFTGTKRHPIFADRMIPFERRHDLPVVMIHGGCNTGTCFLMTPDGRPGWAHNFARAGIETYVIDWPGHGRSPMRADFLTLSSRDVRDSIAVLLGEIGPAILLAHSAGGPLIWSLAETHSNLVGALIGAAPGPPANLVPAMEEDAPYGVQNDSKSGYPIMASNEALFMVDEAFVQDYWFSGPAAPENAAANFYRSVVPESPLIINERFNVAGEGLRVSDPVQVGTCPTLIVSPECDPRHPKQIDAATAELFGADFAWLPDYGIRGNGHMLMADSNSGAIADLMIRWIVDVVPGVVGHP
jgi:pimeloyl-ACP methyl ester carboxylesterase